jgi:hypothetical protein
MEIKIRAEINEIGKKTIVNINKIELTDFLNRSTKLTIL